MSDTSHSYSAHELAELFRARKLSPLEHTREVLEHAARRNGDLKAFCHLDGEAALSAAKRSEVRYGDGTPLSPLDGVAVGVKDNIYVAGMPATWGSLLYRDFRPAGDDVAIARLREAGAIILGKTNTPELALAGFTDNRLFGRTRNPRNTAIAVGGSSGGSAAAVAGGLTPLAIGTDAGGSIRLPASLNGIYGFKPTTGRIPRRWGFPPLALDFQVVAPMARNLADIRASLAVMAGPSHLDPSSCHLPHPQSPARPLRIGAFSAIGENPVDEACREAVSLAAETIRQAGHEVSEIACPFDLEILRSFWGVLSASGVARVVTRFPGWEEKVTEPIRAQAERGLSLSAVEYASALDLLTEFRLGMAEFFRTFDAVVCPTCAATPWEADKAFPDIIDGQKADVRGNAIFTTFVNAIGHPAMNLPYHATDDGRPVGIQLIGGFGADALLLDLGAEVMRTARWNTAPSL